MKDRQLSENEERTNQPRARSPWNLLLIPLCVLSIVGVWVGIVWGVEHYRTHLCPPDAFLFNGTRLGNIFFFVAPGFPSLAAGLIVGNLLLWCVPAARATIEREPSGGAFRASQFGLAKLGAVLAGIALPLCFMGASNVWALTPDRIEYRPMLSVAARNYSWSSVATIETGCFSGKSTSYDFVVTLDDKTRINLMEESPRKFTEAFPQIQAALRGKNYRFSSDGLVGRCVASMPRRWLEILSKPPTD
ncbi:MAG TPA: hypothetical protein VKP61_17510 [Candidatus Acidoferrum sp.]|nr:hypothetical protein [Candidatus Acidoferrum sp.]